MCRNPKLKPTPGNLDEELIVPQEAESRMGNNDFKHDFAENI
jgi:hypothetical protein